MAGLPSGFVRDKKTAQPGRKQHRASEVLLDAIQKRESGNDPNAVSPKGAQGLAQIMPDTAADPGYGVDPVKDPFDPKEARRFLSQYYNAMLTKFDGDHELVVAPGEHELAPARYLRPRELLPGLHGSRASSSVRCRRNLVFDKQAPVSLSFLRYCST